MVDTDVACSPYCDASATTPAPFCDGSQFDGVHYLKDDDIYCQWQVSTGAAKCYNGQTGEVVDPPLRTRNAIQKDARSLTPFAFQNLVHVKYPGLAEAMWNEEREGPMPDGYSPIASLAQWLSLNGTTIPVVWKA